MNHTEEHQIAILEDYKNGMFIKEIAAKYKHSPKTIRAIFRENGWGIEKRWRRKDELDVNYFEKINSPIKAYFLGFLFADGFILRDAHTTGINLNIKDRKILEKFSEEVYKTKDRVYDIPVRGQSEQQSRVIVKSKIFQDHLIDKNFKFRKSLTVEPPVNLPENLIKFFILGYFDGNGSFSVSTWSIVSTKVFCEWVANYLINKSLVSKVDVYPAQNKITHRLRISRKFDLQKMHQHFYADAPLFLSRKERKLFNYLNNGNGPKRFPKLEQTPFSE